MLLLVSSALLMSLSLSLILASSPLAMGFWVLLIALACSFFSASIFNTWFAMIIFLVYIGGMLVMFAYFTALTPNQPLGLSIMLLMSSLAFFMFLLMTSSLNSIMPSLISLKHTSMIHPITIMFAPYNSSLLFLLASILFFILVAVVKITNISSGPLRPFN
uniref:NADH dehydrogenase subunit 6 n=1 Tax=Eunoe nodosa TaxID=862926 RepID=A0A8B6QMG9_9ANNE|nr:NADH dehydrogenase subunit 6 [Eunoe nodosa]QTJ29912.1 NADH dehydrogenase subunit 6 [Eunoe nodosa]